jgi:predicted house-cleaning noncanonical NTP pyrophosphatase (MazG superfamily)
VSIFATIPGLGSMDDDPAVGAPWRYGGSHILPREDDPRGGVIDLAVIPSHITRDGRDDQPQDDAPWPWLRMSLNHCGADPTVILSPDQARHLARQLADWADSAAAGHASRPRTDPEAGKLVRDYVPQIIRQLGAEPDTHTAGPAEYRRLLWVKLGEAAAEFRGADGAAAPEELADVLEVVHALAADAGIDSVQLEDLRAAKERGRGSFTGRTVWTGNRKPKGG